MARKAQDFDTIYRRKQMRRLASDIAAIERVMGRTLAKRRAKGRATGERESGQRPTVGPRGKQAHTGGRDW